MSEIDLELSFVTELSKLLHTYVKDIVVKREDLAKKYETLETIRNFDFYLAARNQTDSFESYGEYSEDILREAGLTDEEIRLAKLNIMNVPESKRQAVLEAQRRYILEHFEERNDYYRMLMGLPSINDNMFIYISDDIQGVDKTKPVHLMTDDEISILTVLGYIDQLISEHPKRPYLKYLGNKKIDLITARTARRFDILRTGNIDNEKIRRRFEINYTIARNYILNTFYLKSLSGDQEYYDAYIGFVILMYTLMMTINDSIQIYNASEYSNELLIKQLLQSFNLDIFDDISLTYRKKIADNLQSLIVSKGTDEVIFKIFRIFDIEDITIKKFMIVKEHKKDNTGKYIFSYDFDGLNTVENEDLEPLAGVPTASAWSSNGRYLAIGIKSEPYLEIYARNNDILTKITEIDFFPTEPIISLEWSPDGGYLVLTHEVKPYVTLYRVEDESFERVLNTFPDIDYSTYSVSWSANGEYLAFGHDSDISLYKVAGNSFVKLNTIDILPSGKINDLAWCPESTHLAVVYNEEPYINAYLRQNDNLFKIDDINLTIPSIGNSCSWAPNSMYLSVCHEGEPGFTVFKRNENEFIRLLDPDTPLTGGGTTSVWNANGRILLIGHKNSPYLSVYNRIDDDLFKMDIEYTEPDCNEKVIDLCITSNDLYTAVVFDNEPYLRLYKANNYTPIYNDMYDISFSAIDIRTTNIDAEIRKPENKLAYTEITSKDIYWGGYESDEAIRQKLLKEDFNYIETDYISIDSAYSLSNIVTEMSYFFSIVFSLKNYLKKMTLIEPIFGHTVDVFYMLTMVTALMSKKIGYDGNIVTDPVNIAEVYRFNFERSLTQINNIMKKYYYNGNPNEYLILNPSAEVTDPKVLTSIYFYNMDIHNKILNIKSTTKDLNEYLALRELDDYLLRSKVVADVFKKKDGTIASTYLDYLKDSNIIIGEYIENVQSQDIDSVLFKILSTLEDYFNEERFRFIFLKTPNVSGDESIKKYMKKVINTFKAFTINIISITVTYALDNKNTNNIKILDGVDMYAEYSRIGSIPVIDSLGINGEQNCKTNVKIRDELELIS